MRKFEDFIFFKMKIKSLIKEKKFDAAVFFFKKNSKFFLDADLLVMKATVIQLAENSCLYSLDDARSCLILATRVDPDHVGAWCELGYFYYAIDDNSKDALVCFERALLLAQGLYINSVVGVAKALVDLGNLPLAECRLKSAKFIDDSVAIKDLLTELGEGGNCSGG